MIPGLLAKTAYIAQYLFQLPPICMHLHASATMFIMIRKGLTQRAGGKQPSCKKIEKAVGEHSLKEKEASRERRGWP